MRLVLATAALCVVTGCSGSTPESDGAARESPTKAGSVELKALCPEIHTAVDALIASSPDSQRVFVEQLERLSAAGTAATQQTMAPLLAAGKALAEAGVGPDFYAARDGIHPAVVSVDADCVRLGSPILHGGPH